MFDVWRWKLSGAFPVEIVGPEVFLLLPFPCFVPGVYCHDIHLRRITNYVRKLLPRLT